jgi:choline monooxygenase
MIFACLDADAPPLATWAGELAGALAAAAAVGLESAFVREYTIAANWKLFVENAMDAYHVQFVHDVFADLVAANDSVHFFEKYSSYSLVPVNPTVLPPGVPSETAVLRIGNLFPNLICVLSPFELTYLRIDPIAPEQIRLVGRSFDTGEQQFVSREFRQQAFERTTEQDIAVVERVQRGLHAHGLPRGVYASQGEARIGHFEQLVADALAHS